MNSNEQRYQNAVSEYRTFRSKVDLNYAVAVNEGLSPVFINDFEGSKDVEVFQIDFYWMKLVFQNNIVALCDLGLFGLSSADTDLGYRCYRASLAEWSNVEKVSFSYEKRPLMKMTGVAMSILGVVLWLVFLAITLPNFQIEQLKGIIGVSIMTLGLAAIGYFISSTANNLRIDARVNGHNLYALLDKEKLKAFGWVCDLIEHYCELHGIEMEYQDSN